MVYLSLASEPDDLPGLNYTQLQRMSFQNLHVFERLRHHLTFPQNEQSLHPDSFWWNISQNTNCSYANLGAPETTQYKLRANLRNHHIQKLSIPFFMKNTSISHLLATTTSHFWDLCNAGNDFSPPSLLGDLNIAWLQPNANLLTYVRDKYNQKRKFYLGGTICVLFTIEAPLFIFQIRGRW